MAGQNSTVVRPAHHDTGMSLADELAHLAASYVRTAPGDSDPDPDEALRRARGFAPAGSIR
ncbi:hypothetical protein [Streptomyces sp. NBC_01789]|uniref:hypothetical protein n=1 Tax=Streptomyces sp. NBC_01789 TaxID=2975941 RepID=UPI00225B81CA|nr:hypothetical protein [Streptomyces sp. NBC_01789]MCX4450658.1 hypothetical protein [Streptomyces sp. NBC_01789]